MENYYQFFRKNHTTKFSYPCPNVIRNKQYVLMSDQGFFERGTENLFFDKEYVLT